MSIYYRFITQHIIVRKKSMKSVGGGIHVRGGGGGHYVSKITSLDVVCCLTMCYDAIYQEEKCSCKCAICNPNRNLGLHCASFTSRSDFISPFELMSCPFINPFPFLYGYGSWLGLKCQVQQSLHSFLCSKGATSLLIPQKT